MVLAGRTELLLGLVEGGGDASVRPDRLLVGFAEIEGPVASVALGRAENDQNFLNKLESQVISRQKLFVPELEKRKWKELIKSLSRSARVFRIVRGLDQ